MATLRQLVPGGWGVGKGSPERLSPFSERSGLKFRTEQGKMRGPAFFRGYHRHIWDLQPGPDDRRRGLRHSASRGVFREGSRKSYGRLAALPLGVSYLRARSAAHGRVAGRGDRESGATSAARSFTETISTSSVVKQEVRSQESEVRMKATPTGATLAKTAGVVFKTIRCRLRRAQL